MTAPDPMHRIHAVKDSIRAKTASIPAADHNGFVIDPDDPDRPRYGAGLAEPVEPKPTTKGTER
ncbi:MAG: hypothetical protein ACRDTJ_30255 [Pseudonocardiaceae bacterium]